MAAVIEIPAKPEVKAEVAAESAFDVIPGVRLFTAAEYQRMAEFGVLGEDERVELIEGRIVRMAPKNMLHATATSRANRRFLKLLGDRAIVRVQDPILLNDLSEPEPDLVLAAPPEEMYLEHHPTPPEIFMVLEIADSSADFDRRKKGPLYARNGIIQYCLLDLRSRELEDYRDPGPHVYRTKQTYTEGESFGLVSFPKVSIKVSDLLPPTKAASSRRKK
jgi:Uma2 family endonuclease